MIKNFIVATVVYLILDAFWLGIFAKKFYFKAFGDMARKEGNSLKPNLLASALSYIILAIGMAVIVFPNAHSLDKAILYGAIYGLAVYGVYDMTNMATLQGWLWKLSLTDLFWGIFASSVVSVVGMYILK
jgi:uncharacterized membrane protein